MKKLFIFPYNGNGLEALDCIGDEYEFIGFIDDTKEKQGVQENDHNVFTRNILNEHKDAFILAVPGSSISFTKREEIINSLNIRQDKFATLIHPKASISPLSKIGFNTLIMAGVVITSNAIIGNHVCILPNTVIHHDCHINDFTLIGSNVVIAGNTTISKNCYIGSGTNIINNIKIGEKTLIGLGSNVIKSVSPNSKAIGNPAKVIGNIA